MKTCSEHVWSRRGGWFADYQALRVTTREIRVASSHRGVCGSVAVALATDVCEYPESVYGRPLVCLLYRVS